MKDFISLQKRKFLAIVLAMSISLGAVACGNQRRSKYSPEWSLPQMTAETTRKSKSTKETDESTKETETTSTPTEVETATTEEPSSTTTYTGPTLEGAKIPLDPAIGFGEGEQDEITAKLLALDSVMAAERTHTSFFTQTYLVLFEVPLDWTHPEMGTFLLRTIFVYRSEDADNMFYCGGYMLDNSYYEYGCYDNLANDYNTNYIECEHRFFGTSQPDGLRTDTLDYWEYLTVENAAADFHFVIEQYKTILSQQWIFKGTSKGGQLTFYQSMMYPNDCDVYVSYVAPGGGNPEATELYDYIYNEIGDDGYGQTEAKKYRDLILTFQVEAMKLKDQLMDRFYEFGIKEGAVYTSYTTPGILYDVAVLNIGVTIWQYLQDFDTIQETLDMDHNSKAFEEAVFDLLVINSDPAIWCNNSGFFPYYVQAATQNGEVKMVFSYLRAALKEQGLEDLLSVTEDMEDGLLFRMIFTPEQFEVFTFDDSVYQDLVEWSHTTECTVIMLYGSADVWYSVRLPDVTDNENIHIFVAHGASHLAEPVYLDTAEQQAFYDIISEALQV